MWDSGSRYTAKLWREKNAGAGMLFSLSDRFQETFVNEAAGCKMAFPTRIGEDFCTLCTLEIYYAAERLNTHVRRERSVQSVQSVHSLPARIGPVLEYTQVYTRKRCVHELLQTPPPPSCRSRGGTPGPRFYPQPPPYPATHFCRSYPPPSPRKPLFTAPPRLTHALAPPSSRILLER